MYMSKEQTQQFMEELQMLERYLSDLTQREATFMNILRDTTATIESLQSFSKNEESETLVPIGGVTMIPTKISANSKIIMNVGAGIAVEKDFPSAINTLEARVKEIEIALQDTVAKKQDASAKLEQGEGPN